MATAASQSAGITVTLGRRSAAGMAAAAAAASSSSTKAATQPAPRRRRSFASAKRPAGPLAGVCAMVDVRVGAEAQIDCSDVVARKLRELGASTVSRFCPKLTHMVLSHLTPTWKLKIAKWQSGVSSNSSAANNGSTGISATELLLISQRRDLKIVSQLWVNACYVSKQRMEEKPFFPISKASDSIAPPRPVISSRHSLGSAWLKRSSPTPEQMSSSGSATDENVNTTNGADLTPVGQKTTSGASTMPAGLKPQTPQRRATATATRKRRALSMEPMTSDAILKLLESNGATVEKSIASQETDANTAKNVELPRAKRRRSISDTDAALASGDSLSQAQPEPLPTRSTDPHAWSECVPQSDSEDDDRAEANAKSAVNEPSEQQTEVANEGKQTTPAAPTTPILRRTRSATALAAGKSSAAINRATSSRTRSQARSRTATSSVNVTPGPTPETESAPKVPQTAPVASTSNARRRTGHPGIALKSGIWSCSACGCSNPRMHRMCRICRKSKNAAAPASKSEAASTERPPVAAGASATTGEALNPVTATPSQSSTLPSPAPSKASKRAPTAPPSAVKAPRTPKRAAPSVVSPLTPADSASLLSIHRQRQTSGKVPITPSVITLKTPHKPRMVPSTQSAAAASPSPQKPFPSSILLKRLTAGSPVSTPASKRQRVSSPATSGEVSDLGTPQSVASSYRQRSKSSVGSASVMATSKLAVLVPSAKKTPRKSRVVIAITGLDPEARNVIECAVHAIDASVSSEEGSHRKARVVKSLDYAAAVTHLIVGQEAKRTIKVLFAIARGAWVVPESWVFSSLEKERWLPEEPFEMPVFANKYSRLHPESRQIFRGLKFFVGSNVEPSREVMQSLIQCAGGEICNQISVADVCICADSSLFRRAQRTGVRVVSSKWVFDSIAGMKLADERNYSPMGGAPAAPATGLEAATTETPEEEDEGEDDAYQQVARVSA